MATVLSPRDRIAQIQFVSGLDVVAALWLFISGFAVPATQAMQVNDWVCGIVVGIIAACRALGAYTASWLSWINVLIGLWVLITPWTLGIGTQNEIWNGVLTGLAIIILAAWSALTSAPMNGPGRMMNPPPRPM